LALAVDVLAVAVMLKATLPSTVHTVEAVAELELSVKVMMVELVSELGIQVVAVELADQVNQTQGTVAQV
jgi:hypothetical protein